jgi:hypothetical protein
MFTPAAAATIPAGASSIVVADNRIVAKPIEQLPLSRERLAVTGRLGWRTPRTTLRFEERLYADTWSMQAATTDVRWYVDIGERLMLWPHLRVHAQGGVGFWQRAYAAPSIHELPTLRTGDRELGPLTSFGLGAGARIALGKRGRREDFVLSFTGDGTWTSFPDTLYVKERFSVLGTSNFEVAF